MGVQKCSRNLNDLLTFNKGEFMPNNGFTCLYKKKKNAKPVIAEFAHSQAISSYNQSKSPPQNYLGFEVPHIGFGECRVGTWASAQPWDAGSPIPGAWMQLCLTPPRVNLESVTEHPSFNFLLL